jgi:hypothetical protein
MAISQHRTAQHQAIVDRAAALEEARLSTNALRANRPRLNERDGVEMVDETRVAFEREKAAAAREGRKVDPRFAGWVAWERATARFHEALDAMYPSATTQALESLRNGEIAAAEWATVFLEADPRCFRSGYVKERILRYLSRIAGDLSPDIKSRLVEVIVAAVDDLWRPVPWGPNPWRTTTPPQRREFKWYCRLARNLAAPELRTALESRTRSSDAVVADRARRVLGTPAP